MNFKNSEFLWLVVAFLLGYFMRQICSGKLVEGLNTCIPDTTNSNYALAQKHGAVQNMVNACLTHTDPTTCNNDQIGCTWS